MTIFAAIFSKKAFFEKINYGISKAIRGGIAIIRGGRQANERQRGEAAK